ncbi:axin isoform X2 [Toxorhynchites rutilus septentrionalis]|uniref:axin isoform X2 n=1 Tax=Toxorhynchites rutilus septentrionalis TaxID=329112 RepID=UPI0024788CBE|nr:axin isoform X2 [Toxorhynchites rutilus septentrionalis]
MSQYSSYKFDDLTCSGPRPPVPGKESRPKMTESLHQNKSRISPPAYYKWADKLTYLLEDGDGAELFRRFLDLEGAEHVNHLKFYFACEGLKQESDPEKVTQLIVQIYKRFLKRAPRDSKLYVDDDMRNLIKAGLKNEKILTPDIYDQMQADIVRIISTTTYPNFLQSDLYIQYVQNMQTSSTSGSGGGASCAGASYGLPIAGASSTSAGTVSSMTSSSSTSELISHSSSALPTLHEDSELVNADSIEQLYGATGPAVAASSMSLTSGVSESGSSASNMTFSKPTLALTKDALLDTQRRRLEMRPPGDGRSQSQWRDNHRHHTLIERRLMNENAKANKEPQDSLPYIPRTQRHTGIPKPLPEEEFASILNSKLVEVKQKQDQELLRKKLQEKLQVEDENDQDILDQHVSRVWSDLTPSRSPDAMSPCPNISRSRRHEMGVFGSGLMSAQSSMRHSKSMPDGHPLSMMAPPLQPPRKLNNKWPSVNTDSGISLFSADTLTKYSNKDMQCSSRPLSRTMHIEMSQMNTAAQLQESSRRLEDETRRSKRYQQGTPPLSAGSMSLVPPPIPARPDSSAMEFTVVVYSFCDEEMPYRIKIPGIHPPTLKQFKDYLPKKGNYRFFFKTRCGDLDDPVIQEEIINDNERLPLFEGKVMGTVKPLE